MTFNTATRYRRRRQTMPFLWLGTMILGCLSCGMLGYFLYQLPVINDKLFWRVEVAKAGWDNLIHPRTANVLPTVAPTPFQVQARRPTVAPTIQLAFEATFPASPTPLASPTPRPFATPTPTPTMQFTPTLIPAQYLIEHVPHEYQQWNNCGPATLAMALGYWGWKDDQTVTAAILKPNKNDKNVRPDEMSAFTEQTGFLSMAVRWGGTMDLLKSLISNNYPVIIEKGFWVDEERGWMGHYLLLIGYDDNAQQFIGQDSFEGPQHAFGYADLDSDWQAFNRVFLIPYPPAQGLELDSILGEYATVEGSYAEALEASRRETRGDSATAFAWHNLGTNYNYLGDYQRAAAAFDEARNVGLPWRMLWYQFGLYRAYYEQQRYPELADIAQYTISNGGGDLEESFFWLGSAQRALGDLKAAHDSMQKAIKLNPNFAEAQTLLADITLAMQPTITPTVEPTYAFPTFALVTPKPSATPTE